MNIRRYSFYIITCICFALLLSGCGVSGDFSALEQLRVVRTLGFDRGGERVTLSVSGDMPGADTPPLRLQSEGSSIRAALDGLRQRASDGELFYAHTQFLVVGRKTAEHDISDLLDYAERDENLRLGAWFFVLEDNASALVADAGDEQFDVTEALMSARRDLTRRGERALDLRETAVALSEYGAAPVCVLRMEETDGTVSLSAGGCGILKDGILIEVLPEGESDAFWLLKEDPGVRTRPVLDGATTLEYSGSAKFTPRWNPDGSPGVFGIDLKIQAGVAEGGADVPIDTLSQALKDSLTADVTALLARLKALDADLLAFGRELRLSDGSRYADLPPDWLTRMEFEVAVDVVFSRGYDLDDATAGEDDA